MQHSAPNLKTIRQLYNLTQEEFAAALGITRELVNKMEKGRTGVSKATRLLVQEFLKSRKSEEISHSGSGDVEIFGTPRQPYHLERREQKGRPLKAEAPLVGIKAQAGFIRGFEQVDYLDTLEKYSLPPGVNPVGAVWSYFEVDGDSMEPTIYSGDVILASMMQQEDWNDVRNFHVYVILTGDQLLVKRVFRKNEKEWVLVSDNEEVQPQVLLPVDQIRQVWTFRRHIRSRMPQPREFRITA